MILRRVATPDRVVLAVIPARGGSRGLPGKHLRRLGGLPLIAHTINAARDAKRVTHVLVTTDDRAIRAAARRFGADAPFVRPAELSTDEAPTEPVVAHAVDWFEADRGTSVDIIVTLQPTSPLRTAEQIDLAIGLLDEREIDSAVSVAPTGLAVSVVGTAVRGRWQALAPRELDARRQSVPQVVRLTGGIYVTRRDVLRGGALTGTATATILVDARSAIDVDSIDDLHAARSAWRRSP